MVESSWSDPQSGVTTELQGEGEVSNYNDARRRRGVVPRLRPRPCNGSDQQVPVYWDQTVPVWEASRSSSKRKAPDSLCYSRHGNRFRSGAGGATMLTVDKTLESSCCEAFHSTRFAASEEVAERNSPASRCSLVASLQAAMERVTHHDEGIN